MILKKRNIFLINAFIFPIIVIIRMLSNILSIYKGEIYGEWYSGTPFFFLIHFALIGIAIIALVKLRLKKNIEKTFTMQISLLIANELIHAIWYYFGINNREIGRAHV